jgi:dTDP-4-amino-4,6-dideoxygalactose transaminase
MRLLPPVATPVRLGEVAGSVRAFSGYVDLFRIYLAAYLNVPDCFPAASGRTAFYLLLQAMKQMQPDRSEIVLPAYTCPALGKVVFDAGLVPRLVDISPESCQYRPDELAAAVGAQTLAIVWVHPFGLAYPVHEALRLARRKGAFLVEDAAQSLGARAGGKFVGTAGDFGLFSLGPGKPMSTGGGGVVCMHNPGYLETVAEVWEQLPRAGLAASLAAAVRLALFTAAFHPRLWWLAARLGAQRVGENEANWGYRLRSLTRTQAKVGLHLLPHLEGINVRRRWRAQQIIDGLQGIEAIRFVTSLAEQTEATGISGAKQNRRSKPAKTESIYLRLPLLAANESMAERLVEQLAAAGIGAGRMYRKTMAEFFPPLATQPFPGAEEIARCLVTLPTHHFVRDEDVQRMTAVVRQVIAVG